MNDKIDALKADISALAANRNFIHHKWFVTHHLSIVEQLALELCDLYPQANKEIVLAMVWLHDLGKILTNKQVSREEETRVTLSEGQKKLEQFGFAAEFIDQVITNLEIFEQSSSRDLLPESIEIQIVSTADGCSHYIGPFMALHWYENPDKSIEAMIDDNKRKIEKDWTHKIVLPEARKSFFPRLVLFNEFDPSTRIKQFFR